MRQCLFAIVAIGLLSSGSVFAKCGDSPTAVTSEFYSQYVKTFADYDMDTTGYVVDTLNDQITKDLNSDNPPDTDYFMKVQDALPAWSKKSGMSVSETSKDKDEAVELVKFGPPGKPELELSVHLVNENSCWKINQVDDLTGVDQSSNEKG